ncbi:MAG: universal stress protein [Anaerolineae bacterium]|nr:universal stress protein [Anaerolineae bacterium]
MASVLDSREQIAAHHFNQARQQGTIQDILARLTGRSNDLLSYEEVRRQLKGHVIGKRDLHEIPVAAIIGSVGRYQDFTRQFLPRNPSTVGRWSKIKVEMEGAQGVWPIEVYKVGDAYFVLDGNHRVSVARAEGASHIEAYVTEVETRVPLTPDVSPDTLILKAEQTDFFEATDLDQTRPEANLTVTNPGQYEALLDDIEDKRRVMTEAQGGEVSLAAAATAWYEEVYLPIVHVIRERGMLRDFPNRTETDLYVWISRRRAELEETLGWAIDVGTAAADVASARGKSPVQTAANLGGKLIQAVTPSVFEAGPRPGQWRRDRHASEPEVRFAGSILVPINGEADGWDALSQAILVAQREGGRLNGLHIVQTAEARESEAARAVRAEFDQRCQAAGVRGNLVIEVGGVTATICERARWNDMVVVTLAHPPSASPMARLRNGFRGLVQLCSRPILAVPHTVSPLSAALVSYDGSAKATEALYAAAYLGLHGGTRLVVLTVLGDGPATDETLARARQYLDAHEVQATYLTAPGPVAEAIPRVVAEQGCDLILMGGYGYTPLIEAVLGSAVDQVLRESQVPVLICR